MATLTKGHHRRGVLTGRFAVQDLEPHTIFAEGRPVPVIISRADVGAFAGVALEAASSRSGWGSGVAH